MTIFDDMIDWRRTAIDNPEFEAPGVYSFWLGKMCIYVGKGNQINRRLLDHWMHKSHVKELHDYFDDYGRLIKLFVRPCETQNEASKLEVDLVRKFRPKLNINRFGV